MINGCIIHMYTGLPRICIGGENKYFALDAEFLSRYNIDIVLKYYYNIKSMNSMLILGTIVLF